MATDMYKTYHQERNISNSTANKSERINKDMQIKLNIAQKMIAKEMGFNLLHTNFIILEKGFSSLLLRIEPIKKKPLNKKKKSTANGALVNPPLFSKKKKS